MREELKKVIDEGKLIGDLILFSKALSNIATIQKIKFDSLVKAGFTESQALELCKGPVFQQPFASKGGEDGS